MRRRRHAALLAACVGLAVGCADEVVETAFDAVVVEGEPPLAMPVDVVRISIERIGEGAAAARIHRMPTTIEAGRLRPITVRLEPDDGDEPVGSLYRVRAEGLRDESVVVYAQHRVAFVRGRVLTLPLRFTGDCAEVSCTSDRTCIAGSCYDDRLCATGGSDLASCDDAGTMDAAVTDANEPEPDVGPDARDMAIDAIDAGPDARDMAVEPPDLGPDPFDAEPADDMSTDAGPPPDLGPSDAGACTCPDDGIACTLEECDERRSCRHVLSSGCLIGTTCVAAGAINPADMCQGCDPSQSTSAWSPRLGASCDDGRACTLDDRCAGRGTCAGTPRTCVDPPGGCTRTCNETTGACGLPSGVCEISGACFSMMDARPGQPCEACLPMLDANGWSARPVGSICDDGLFCTTFDRCTAGGTCTGMPRVCMAPLVCDEFCDACTIDVCG